MMQGSKKDIFFFFPFVTIAIFLVPIASGLIFVTLGALGLDGAIAAKLPQNSSHIPLWAFFDRAGIMRSIGFTIFIGMGATIIAWGINCLFLGFGRDNLLFQICQRFLSPILAMPHITLAVGLLFLAAPSGIIARILALFTGWETPPLWQSNPDPYGLLLLLGLVMKELPFLFLLSLSALERIDIERHLLAGQVLGYSKAMTFFKIIYPLLYQQMRLPIFVVLAFSLSIVDMALVLAPHAPQLLAVKILHWARDPNLSEQYFAASGAFWMFILTLLMIALWVFASRLLAYPYRIFIIAGWRGRGLYDRFPIGKYLSLILTSGLIFAGLGAIMMLAIWSVAGLWSFPDLVLPKISWRYWMRAFDLMHDALPLTILIALVASLLSMILVIGCLEAENRHGFKPQQAGMMILYLPLLVPQISFLFGVQILLLRLNLSGTLMMVILGHMIFVLPYIYLSLSGVWRKLNPHYRLNAHAMGKSPNQTLWRLILPLQLSPLLTAFALGVAVSVALYLPTHLLGDGRYATLTTEAIVLSSGGNRRIVSVYGLVQAFVPLVFFTLAIFVPRWLYQNRREMNVRT